MIKQLREAASKLFSLLDKEATALQTLASSQMIQERGES